MLSLNESMRRFLDGELAKLTLSDSKSGVKLSIGWQLFIIALIYTLLSPPVSLPCYERLLFFPDNKGFEPTVALVEAELAKSGCIKRDVRFPAENGDWLHGWFFVKPDAECTVIVSHGNAGNIASRIGLASALVHSGCSVLLYDYRGYGTSGGVPSISGICNDANSAYDFLAKDKEIRNRGIVAYGESLGAAVSTALSLRRPVRALILQSAFPSLLYACRDRLWFTWLYPDSWFPVLDNLKPLSQSHPPLLILHGSADRIFPLAYAKAIFNNASQKKRLAIINNMPHVVEPAQESEVSALVSAFLRKYVHG